MRPSRGEVVIQERPETENVLEHQTITQAHARRVRIRNASIEESCSKASKPASHVLTDAAMSAMHANVTRDTDMDIGKAAKVVYHDRVVCRVSKD